MLIIAVGQLEVIRFCSTRTAFFISCRTALYHTIPYCTVLHQNKLYQNGLIILHYGNVISYYILYSLSPYVFILYISIPLSLSLPPYRHPSLSYLLSICILHTHKSLSLSLCIFFTLCPLLSLSLLLQMLAQEYQYREAANLLDAVKQLMTHFNKYVCRHETCIMWCSVVCCVV
jgi:hypothetical protein